LNLFINVYRNSPLNTLTKFRKNYWGASQLHILFLERKQRFSSGGNVPWAF
jgi:hypothetical protein